MTIALKIIMHSDVHKFLDTHIDTGDSICPAVIAPQWEVLICVEKIAADIYGVMTN